MRLLRLTAQFRHSLPLFAADDEASAGIRRDELQERSESRNPRPEFQIRTLTPPFPAIPGLAGNPYLKALAGFQKTNANSRDSILFGPGKQNAIAGADGVGIT